MKISERIQAPETIYHYPPHLRDARVIKAICHSFDEELKKIYAQLDDAEADCYIDSLTERGCDLWEHRLRLDAISGASLEYRRNRIKTAQMQQPPYTEKRLDEMLISICGAGNYFLLVDREKQKLTVRIRPERIEDRDMLLATVGDLLKGWIPVNILVDLSAYEYATVSAASISAAAATYNLRFNVKER